MPPVDLIMELAGIVARRAPPDGVTWLTEHLVFDRESFGPAFSGAARRLGKAPITEADVGRLREAGLPWAPGSGADECGRAALLLAALGSLDATEHVVFVRDLLRRGELRERQAILRVLAGLPQPQRFVELAVDASRTNAASVFTAIACDNAYPARHFDDAQFNQLVLKALFTNTGLARIEGLRARATQELVRMIEAYASECRAAGRPVPDDAKLVKP